MKKTAIAWAVTFLIICVVAWRVIVTNPNYVFREARSRIMQIKNHEYIESVSVKRPTLPYVTEDYRVKLVPGLHRTLVDEIVFEIMEVLDTYGKVEDTPYRISAAELNLIAESTDAEGNKDNQVWIRGVAVEDGVTYYKWSEFFGGRIILTPYNPPASAG